MHVSPDTVWHVERIVIAENSQLVRSIVLPEAVNSFVVSMSLYEHRQLRLLLLLDAIVVIHAFQHYIHHITRCSVNKQALYICSQTQVVVICYCI